VVKGILDSNYAKDPKTRQSVILKFNIYLWACIHVLHTCDRSISVCRNDKYSRYDAYQGHTGIDQITSTATNGNVKG
jgi:hypothetical protein